MGDVVKLPIPTAAEREIEELYAIIAAEGWEPEDICSVAAMLKYCMNKHERRIIKLEAQVKKLTKKLEMRCTPSAL